MQRFLIFGVGGPTGGTFPAAAPPVGADWLVFEGRNTSEASTTGDVNVTLLTVSGLNIPTDKYIFVAVQWRTDPFTSEEDANLGLVLNGVNSHSTELVNFAAGAVGESNMMAWFLPPRENASYYQTGEDSAPNKEMGGGGFMFLPEWNDNVNFNRNQTVIPLRNNNVPIGSAITSVAVRGRNDNPGVQTLFVKNLTVHTLPTA
ncbi:MAG: hypothetical protein ACE5Q6_16860 [Dehalococcoidia bacterium]